MSAIKPKGAERDAWTIQSAFINPSFHNFLEGGGKHLFQAWLDLELAAVFLSLSRHFCGAAAVLLAASAHEQPVCSCLQRGCNFIPSLQIYCFDFVVRALRTLSMLALISYFWLFFPSKSCFLLMQTVICFEYLYVIAWVMKALSLWKESLCSSFSRHTREP